MEPVYSDLGEQIAQVSRNLVLISFALLIVLSFISIKIKKPGPKIKRLLFASIAVVTIGVSLFLAGSTIYLNVVSSSKGPVHHHADFEIYKCGEEQDIKNPKGLSNKIGSPTLHEHNDKRIHIEGVIVNPQDASIANFIRVLDGKFQKNSISFPGNNGTIIMTSGDKCPGELDTKLQTFLYKVEGKNFTQTKLTDAPNYIISPHSNIPPGDCLIIELDKEKDETDKMCRSFTVAIETGDISETK